MRADSLFDVAQEIVVITGVAGGLGSEYAAAFLQANALVIGLDVRCTELCSALEASSHGRFHFITSDVTNHASLVEAYEVISKHHGSPTVLINNAAIDSPPDAPLAENGPFETYPDTSWDRVMDVNVKGVYLSCKVFGGAMARARKGSIINVSSIYGLVSPDQSIYEYRRRQGEEFFKPVAYSVSKSALHNLTRYLAVYWARSNVRVNTLVLAGVENNQDPEFLKAYCDRIPVGRMAAKSEYNGAVLFLASAASRYMTGSELIVDGGWTAI